MISSFKAVRVRRTETISSVIEDVSLEELPDGEVLIKSSYSSINYKDTLAITGAGKILKSFPMIPGIDVSGVVVESRAAQFKQGDEVLVTGYGLGQDRDGGLSEYVRVPADWVIKLDQGLSMHEAMALGTAGFTAALAIQKMIDNGQTPDGGPILVTGASGGVGSIAVNCLTQLGYEVIAMSGKRDARGYLQELGAVSVVDRQSIKFGDRPLEKSLWAGAIDNVGGDVLSGLSRCIARHGNVASCGMAGGINLEMTVMPFILRGINLLGVDSATCPMQQRIKIWQRLAGDMKPNQLEKITTATIHLDGVFDVCARMLAGQTQGRYVVKF